MINLKGLVKYARGDGYTELREVEQTYPASNEVVIAVKAAGVCGSDLHIYHDEMKTPLEIPVVIGHEFSGEIIEIGSEVEEFNIGNAASILRWDCSGTR
ncbi:MAG: alcohol dehydrogenase catalytic domain-containing protein [Candidatus Poribacteria bacterium]